MLKADYWALFESDGVDHEIWTDSKRTVPH